MRLTTAAASLALAAGTVIAQPSSATAAVPQYRACPTEDSVRCVWRADVRGNGEGRSFVAGAVEGKRTYVRHSIARKLIRHDGWTRVPARLVGEAADLVGGRRSKTITARTVWSVGDTTVFVWPHRGRVGTS